VNHGINMYITTQTPIVRRAIILVQQSLSVGMLSSATLTDGQVQVLALLEGRTPWTATCNETVKVDRWEVWLVMPQFSSELRFEPEPATYLLNQTQSSVQRSETCLNWTQSPVQCSTRNMEVWTWTKPWTEVGEQPWNFMNFIGVLDSKFTRYDM